jgi:hypothetical protein
MRFCARFTRLQDKITEITTVSKNNGKKKKKGKYQNNRAKN